MFPLGSNRIVRRVARAAVLAVAFAAFGCIAQAAGAGRTLSWPGWTGAGEPVLNGSAKIESDRLRLTDGPTQSASAFTKLAVIDTAVDFSAAAQIEAHGGDSSADGMAFVVQSDPRGALAIGNGGGALGYGSDEAQGDPPRIEPSVAVEIDIHDNTTDGVDDPDGNHVAVVTGGLFRTPLASAPVAVALHGSGPVHVWIDYAASTTRLAVFVAATSTKPDTPALETTVDLADLLGDAAHAGWTAGTGGFWSIFDVIDWTLAGTKHPTTTALSCTSSSCTATVTESPNTNVAPTGSVVFTGGGSCTLAAVGDGESACSAPAPGTGSATGTYAGDDEHFGSSDDAAVPQAASLAIDDVTTAEGDAGTKTATFTVTRAGGTSGAVSVDWATAAGTAAAGTDFTAASGTLSFAPGDTTKTIAVTVNGDTADELDETYTVELTNATGATLGDASGTGTITDDDEPPPAAPALSIGDATKTEGDSGRSDVVVPITLDKAASETVYATWRTEDGTAHEPADYLGGRTSTVVFPPGATTRNVRIPIRGDLDQEADETFTAELSDVAGATVADGTATITIDDDDGPSPSAGVADATIAEGADGVVQITLSAPADRASSVAYKLTGATASAGSDFAADAGTVTIAAGATSATVPVTTHGDAVDEVDETLTVALSSPDGVTLGDATATVTIADDDAAPVLAIDDATTTEGDSGTKTVTHTVRLDRASSRPVTAALAAIGDGAAPATATDFALVDQSVTVPAGDRTATARVRVDGDTTDEPDEAYRVTASSVENGTAGASGKGTIEDDDAAAASPPPPPPPPPADDPVLSIEDGSVAHPGHTRTSCQTGSVPNSLGTGFVPVTHSCYYLEGTAELKLELRLDRVAPADVAVAWSADPIEGTEIPAVLTGPRSGSVTIPAGQDRASITLTLTSDAKPPAPQSLEEIRAAMKPWLPLPAPPPEMAYSLAAAFDEAFHVTVSAPGVTLLRGRATATVSKSLGAFASSLAGLSAGAADVTRVMEAVDGGTATCRAGRGFSPGRGLTFSWSIDGEPVPDTTSAQIVVPTGSVGKSIRCTVDGFGGDFVAVLMGSPPDQPRSETSPPFVVAPNPAAPVNVQAPSIEPTAARAGERLRCEPGAWTGGPRSFAYRWIVREPGLFGIGVAEAVRPGETSPVLVTSRDDADKSMVCQVQAIAHRGASVWVSSGELRLAEAVAEVRVPPTTSPTNGAVGLDVSCVAREDCAGTTTIAVRTARAKAVPASAQAKPRVRTGRRLAVARYRVPAGGSRRIRARLDAAGKRLLRRRGSVRTVVTTILRSGDKTTRIVDDVTLRSRR